SIGTSAAPKSITAKARGVRTETKVSQGANIKNKGQKIECQERPLTLSEDLSLPCYTRRLCCEYDSRPLRPDFSTLAARARSFLTGCMPAGMAEPWFCVSTTPT